MQMQSEAEILSAIAAGQPFAAQLEDGSLGIKVQEYVPYLCTAIHAGHRLREDLVANCLLSEAERLQEEDPYTDQLIDSFPITLVALDSRYEYDLNRSPEHCIYEQAWGHQVWRTPLTVSQRQQSQDKHDRYYRVLAAILQALERRFGGCLLMDIHSYNWQIRQHQQAPIFNLGTAQIDLRRSRKILSVLEQKLSEIDLPHLETEVGRDQAYQGRGYQARFTREVLANTLTIPLEIKKIFMDEKNGELFPLVLEKLQEGLHLAILQTADTFNQKLRRSKLKRINLVSSDIEPIVLTVDKALNRIAKNIETLHYVNPINIQNEKHQFLSQRGYQPNFRYRQLRIDPYAFREQIYKLPVSQIQDPLIRKLYRSVVDAYATKIDLLSKVGTPQFLYNSLRYYGEPSSADIANAKFLLHVPEAPGMDESLPTIPAEEAKVALEQAAKTYGLDCQVILSSRIVAKAMVDNSRRTLLVNRNVYLTKTELAALIHHELGVHMVTTMNALKQPLHVFKLGLPGNTYTQEGLAILSEYLSGNLNIHRLKQLSLRVLAVDMMINGMSFNTVYHRFRDEYSLTEAEAFSLTTRVFRGGGFTKDYLYLKGFRDLVALYRSRNQNLSSLLIGKTGVQFLDTLDSLIEREILQQPSYLTPALVSQSQQDNPVLDFLVSSIQ